MGAEASGDTTALLAASSAFPKDSMRAALLAQVRGRSSTVNRACRLEATGTAGKIQIAESTYERLKHKYQFAPKHSIEDKGNERVPAYWLDQRS